jgi:hypothetical protein
MDEDVYHEKLKSVKEGLTTDGPSAAEPQPKSQTANDTNQHEFQPPLNADEDGSLTKGKGANEGRQAQAIRAAYCA